MLIFGLNIPLNKYFYAEGLISPFGMTALRMTFAAVAFWLVSLFTPKEKVAKKDMLILIVGGICGMFINQGLFAYGLSNTSSIDASIITTSGPLFAMVVAAIVLREPITLKKAGGVLVGGVGAVILVLASQQAVVSHDGSLKGDIAVLCAQLFYATYIVITRPLSEKYSPITMMKWMFLTSALIAMPAFGRDMISAPLFHQGEIMPYLLISFTLLGATFFTYMMIPLAQRRIRPTTISMYNNVQPLVATIVAIMFMGDSFTIPKLVASIFIFGGVYLVTTSKSRKDVLLEQGEVKDWNIGDSDIKK